MERMYLGVGRSKITPEIGAQLYGYSPNIFATAVEDDLTATAFFFKKGDTQALMISITVCLMNNDLCDSIRALLEKETGVPAQNIMLNATHTHTGPNTMGNAGWGEIDSTYCNTIFVPGILSAAREACASAVPAKMAVARGLSDVGVNRREFDKENNITFGQNPWGCYNPEMTILSFRDDNGKILGNMIHYGCHGTAAGQSTLIGRDWSGVMTDTLERETGAVTAFFNGPEGDVGPRISNGLTVGEIRHVHELGHVAAQDAVRIFRTMGEYHQDVTMQAASAVVKIPLKKRISRQEAQELFDKYQNDFVNLAGKLRDYAKSILESYEQGYEDKENYEMPQTMLRLGNTVFTSSIYESFSEIGMRIDKLCPDLKVLSLSNTNGSRSYLVTEDQICRGGYEVMMHLYGDLQPYCPNADWALIRGSVENIRALTEKE